VPGDLVGTVKDGEDEGVEREEEAIGAGILNCCEVGYKLGSGGGRWSPPESTKPGLVPKT
jgi:hypothetical protein